jgi:hypothetical protein
MGSTTALAVVIRVVSILSFFVLDLLPVVDAQTNAQNFFINPTLPGPNQAFSANPVWSVGSTQKIKWRTEYENFTINLWQQDLGFQGAGIGPGPTIFCTAAPFLHFVTARKLMTPEAKANPDRDADEFDWVVQTFTFDLSESDVFFLWLTTDTPGGITSHYFNITERDTSTSSSSSAATLSTSTSSSSASLTSSSAASAAAQATNSAESSNSNKGLSSGTKIGIGVGVGFGGAILILLSTVVALMLRKRKKRRQPLPPPPQSLYMSDEANRSFPGQRPPQVYSQEMEGNHAPLMADKRRTSGGRTVELE